MVAAALSDGAYTLFVADFSDTERAWQAYEALKSVEDGRSVEIEGVLVVKREADGTLEVQKATDHSTKHGLKWGLVGGVALGVLFPPSILGSAAVLGAAGAAAGKVRQRHHHREIEAELQELDRSRSFRNPGSGLRPGCRRDPQGTRQGRRDRRAGRRQGRGGGHEGSGQGGRGRSQEGRGVAPAGVNRGSRPSVKAVGFRIRRRMPPMTAGPADSD